MHLSCASIHELGSVPKLMHEQPSSVLKNSFLMWTWPDFENVIQIQHMQSTHFPSDVRRSNICSMTVHLTEAAPQASAQLSNHYKKIRVNQEPESGNSTQINCNSIAFDHKYLCILPAFVAFTPREAWMMNLNTFSAMLLHSGKLDEMLRNDDRWLSCYHFSRTTLR